MYHKLKSTLAGLGMAASFAAAGLLFGAPLPAVAPPQVAQVNPADDADRIAIRAMTQIALALLEAQAAADAADAAGAMADAAQDSPVTIDKDAHPVVRTTSKLLQLKMPYYSFGALLTRRGES